MWFWETIADGKTLFTGFNFPSVRSKFSLSQNLMKKYRGCRHFSSRASDSFRAGWTIRFEQDERHASSRASISLRTGRASRFRRGEHLASGRASISLRAGRATRFEQGEQLASGGACFSLRAGRTGKLCSPDLALRPSASSFACAKLA